MTSLFDVIDNDERNDRTAGRKAVALAHKKVSERFDGFLTHRVASGDYNARLELIKDEFRDTVRQACEQVGYTDVDGVVHTLWNERLVHAQPRTASTADGDGFDKESRRPKLCPYHSEVVDASLAAGDAQAGYHAYAQHAWTDKHCKGDDYGGGRCSFKPEMTTATYWDEKAEQAEKRREERQQQAEQQIEQPEAFETPQVEEIEQPKPDSDPEAEFSVDAVEPSAEGGEAAEPQAGLAQEELMAVAASAGRFGPLVHEALVPPPQAVPGPPLPTDPANIPGVPLAGPQQQVPQPPVGVPAPAVGPGAQPTFTPTPQTPGQQVPGQQVPGQDPALEEFYRMNPAAQRPVASVKEAEAVVHQDVTKSQPLKMDKRKWTPQNLEQVIPTEGEGSAWPTKRVDPAPAANQGHPRNKDRLTDIGEAVTEHQDVTEKSKFDAGGANKKTWPTSSPSAVS